MVKREKSNTYNRSYRNVERIVKGFANHRRIQILELLQQHPELSVDEVAEQLNINFKTISEHIRRMAISGLVMKRSEGTYVRHKLFERGLSILKFLRILE